jgi:hypothetical protein
MSTVHQWERKTADVGVPSKAAGRHDNEARCAASLRRVAAGNLA